MDTIGITEKVARYVEKENANRLPDDVIERAKDCLIDYLGACFAGSTTKIGVLTLNLIRGLFPSGKCPLIGTDFQSNILGATWGNGISGSALDYDDGHRAPLRNGTTGDTLGQAAGHPGAIVIPSALAFAFDKSVSGINLIEAIVIAYEVGIRFASSRKTHTVLANATGNWGVIASSVAAGKILGLKSNVLKNLLGVAASNQINPPKLISLKDMPMIKESIGWSGVTGAVSALMAETGISGMINVLDNEDFFDGTFFDDLGENFHIMNVYFKPYSCCRMLHPAIDAVIYLKSLNNINIAEVKNILVETSLKAKELDNRQPCSIEEAQYSFPFCIATALKYEKVTPDVMRDTDLIDPAIVDLCAKTYLQLDEKQTDDSEVETLFPRKTAARVTIITSRGEYSAYVDCPKGDAGKPLTRNDLIKKFRESTTVILREKTIQEILDFILNLNSCQSLAELKPLLVGMQQ